MAKVIKKKKVYTRNELEQLSKTELIDRILQVEAHNLQLKQIIEKRLGSSERTKADYGNKKFDFAKCHKRHILLKLYYLGWDYQGLATQEDTTSTIEYHLFSALTKTCLIESRETSNYHRCGRTDKGVSAFSQVISIDVRSRLEPDNQEAFANELPYCKMLNRLLPKNIRCISWCSVPAEISARFDCKWRTYKYYFPRGNLNIEAMDQAAKFIIGSHDFRNLCKMDVANGVVNFSRSIIDAEVTCISKECTDKCTGYDMCELTIKSNAFLWHQIRCIMGILLLVGREQEKPEIIKELLDIENCLRKPQYNLGHYIPLNLFYCEYDNTNWYIDQEELQKVIKDLQEEWCYASVKSTMTRNMLKNLENLVENESNHVNYQTDCLLQGVESKVYKPLMQRDTCDEPILENEDNADDDCTMDVPAEFECCVISEAAAKEPSIIMDYLNDSFISDVIMDQQGVQEMQAVSTVKHRPNCPGKYQRAYLRWKMMQYMLAPNVQKDADSNVEKEVIPKKKRKRYKKKKAASVLQATENDGFQIVQEKF